MGLPAIFRDTLGITELAMGARVASAKSHPPRVNVLVSRPHQIQSNIVFLRHPFLHGAIFGGADCRKPSAGSLLFVNALAQYKVRRGLPVTAIDLAH